MASSILTSSSEEAPLPTVVLTRPALVNNTTYRVEVLATSPGSEIKPNQVRWYVNDEKDINVAGGNFPLANGSSVTNKGITITWIDRLLNQYLSGGDMIYIHAEELIETEYSFKLTFYCGSTRSPPTYMVYPYSILGICILSGGIVLLVLAKVYKRRERKALVLSLLILGVVFIMIGICTLIYVNTPTYSYRESSMSEVPFGE